ncbi:probable LysR-family transcriptional regulator [Pseudomonas sp. Os17]|nr:probable LysR-family transcriptional regulator [Pseudomonas sp. Os17]BAQ78905.1 probable LysR-family transcriptional regulator [Pseudomonas sp. St29]
MKSLRAWGSGLAAMEKLNSALCCATPDSLASATPRGSMANPDTTSAEAPNHRLTEAFAAECALDFMLETRV